MALRSLTRRQRVNTVEVFSVAGAHLVMIVVCVVALLPFAWMLFGSLKSLREISDFRNPSYWWPRQPTLAAYELIFTREGFPTAFRNSAMVAVPNTLMVCLTSAAMGYVLSKYQFPGRDLIFTILLATMMVPFAVVMLPLYVTLKDLKLLNSLWAFVILGLWSNFGVFLLRQGIMGIPNDYIDAARIDGASEWWIFVSVIIPLSRSPLAALAIFTFLGQWDNFMFPSIVLTSPRWHTLPIFLAGLRDIRASRYDIFCAGAMLTVIPMVVIYSIFQRHFVRGLAMSGLKA